MPVVDRPSTAGAALRRRSFLLTWWPWRGLLHVVVTGLLLCVLIVPVGLLLTPAIVAVAELSAGTMGFVPAVVLLVLSALALLAGAPLLSAVLVPTDRARARLVDERPLPAAPARSDEPGEWWRDRYGTEAGWRQVAYTGAVVVAGGLALVMVLTLVAMAVALTAAPLVVGAGDGPVSMGLWQIDQRGEAWGATVLGVVTLLLAPYVWTAVAAVQVTVLRWAVAPRDAAALESRLVDVRRSRARLVDSFDSERQRIERDLHDGAQQRVVTLTMSLSLARMDVESALGPTHPAVESVATAHEQAKELMVELRQFVRGIHPKVLSDVGLVAAVEQLAGAAPVPVEVRAELARRPVPHAESTAYFVVAEALTNVIRHSGASQARVTLRHVDGDLTVDIWDDGCGGVDAAHGTGVTGMADRLAVLDGSLAVSSPLGGPTLLRIRIPRSLEDV